MTSSYGLLAAPLESFLRVADMGSVSRAAEKLHLSQPAVTKQVRTLEEALGVALVERSGRGIRLTEAGELLAEYGRRGSLLLDECRQALADLAQGGRGRLTLGAGVTTCIFHLPAWLRRFRQRHPSVDVVVRTSTSRAVTEQVLDRELDLGFVTSPVRDARLAVKPLFAEDIVLVAAPDFRVRRGISLGGVPLILFPPTTGFRRYLDDTLGSERLGRQVKMETDSVEAIKSFVEVGLGASFLPATSVAGEIAAGRLQRLRLSGLPRLRRSTSVVYRSDRRMGSAAQYFLDVAGTVSTRSRTIGNQDSVAGQPDTFSPVPRRPSGR